MPYISNTDQEKKVMLSEIGADKFEDLINDIPEKFRLQGDLKLEEPLSELEMIRKVNELADSNTTIIKANSFLGAGVYDHYIPAAVDHIVSRPEFYTAYTPYQAEVSQGTLQYIYEYQTLICELTGMDVSNAGMYDGASAAAEAILMASRKTKLEKAVIADNLNPLYKKVIKSYTEGVGIELIYAPTKNGMVDIDALKPLMTNDVACFLLQTPNFLGNIEDAFAIEEVVHSAKKALFIVAVDPISLALLNSPSEYKADIVVGEGQSLGNNPYFGGPLFGFLATTNSLIRIMPGRIVGATLDEDGKRAYTLTMQAREQHIRRAKATSNICSNQSLCTLAATVYMCIMGKKGLHEVAEQSTIKAHYLAEEICKIDGFELYNDLPFFKEFAIKTPIPAEEIISKLKKVNIFAGVDLKQFGFENTLLIAVTEKKSKADIDNFVSALKEVTNG